MRYIVCDMNWDNWGNYFKVLEEKEKIKSSQYGYTCGLTHYPLKHCYEIIIPSCGDSEIYLKYSQAIDYLIPEEYIRWKCTRFGEKNA